MDEQSYADYRAEVKVSQSTMSYDDVKEEMQKRSETIVELDNMPRVEHRWIDRGAVMSCEGANHPNHQAWKKQSCKVQQY